MTYVHDHVCRLFAVARSPKLEDAYKVLLFVSLLGFVEANPLPEICELTLVASGNGVEGNAFILS